MSTSGPRPATCADGGRLHSDYRGVGTRGENYFLRSRCPLRRLRRIRRRLLPIFLRPRCFFGYPILLLPNENRTISNQRIEDRQDTAEREGGIS